MIRFSQLVGDLTSAWILTGDKKYTDAAMRHIRAWFIDQKTMMNPNLLYAQAIKGIATGRGIGIIDTIHLIEVAQSLRLMEAQGIIEDKELQTIRLWFSDYLTWLSTHRYGINEMEAKNNHGTCWTMQVAAFASFTQMKKCSVSAASVTGACYYRTKWLPTAVSLWSWNAPSRMVILFSTSTQ